MSSLTLAEFWNTPSKVTYSPYIAYNRLLCYQQSKLDATPNHDNLPWHNLPTILRQEIRVARALIITLVALFVITNLALAVVKVIDLNFLVVCW